MLWTQFAFFGMHVWMHTEVCMRLAAGRVLACDLCAMYILTLVSIATNTAIATYFLFVCIFTRMYVIYVVQHLTLTLQQQLQSQLLFCECVYVMYVHKLRGWNNTHRSGG